MRVVILQPGYLPWLGFFDQYASSDRFVVYDDVPYDHRGWRNRNRVKTPFGPRWLTVPVHTRGLRGQPIRDARIADAGFARRHLRTIAESYAKARYFDALYPALDRTLAGRHERLFDLDLALIELLLGELGLGTDKLRLASEVAPGRGERATDRLVSICRALGATEYLTGDLARDYLDERAFEEAGVAVRYHGYEHPTYRQLHGAFVPYLSVIDLCLNEGPAAAPILTRRPR